MKMQILFSIAVWFILFSTYLPATIAQASTQLGDLSGPWLLFVDDHVIDSKANVIRSYHTFEKHPGNPVMSGDKPWEGNIAYLYGTVLPDEEGKGYRMWYHSWADREYRMLYATSVDGIHWEKPDLGLVEYKGSKQNNILFRRTHENHNPQVIHTPWEKDPNRCYKLIYFEYGRTPPKFTTTGYWGMVSPDGIHWQDVKNDPILLDSPGDVGNFVWDSHTRRYMGWPKKFSEVRGFRRRCVGFSATENFDTWPASELVLTPDEFDDRWVTSESAEGAHTDFYGLCGFAYESMYLGFLWVFPITDGKNDGPIFVELVTSHDGIHWERQEKPRPPILPLGPEGSWDDGMLFTSNHPLVEQGLIKLYYGGFDVTHSEDGGKAAVGLATLRKDGFASLNAGDEEGIITTKPLTGSTGPLAVNYCTENGWVKVELLNKQGNVLPGYSREDCTILTGDNINATVSWNGTQDLPETGKPLRIRFILNNAELYSFCIGNKATISGL